MDKRVGVSFSNSGVVDVFWKVSHQNILMWQNLDEMAYKRMSCQQKDSRVRFNQYNRYDIKLSVKYV